MLNADDETLANIYSEICNNVRCPCRDCENCLEQHYLNKAKNNSEGELMVIYKQQVSLVKN